MKKLLLLLRFLLTSTFKRVKYDLTLDERETK